MTKLIAVVAVAYSNGSVGRMQLYEREIQPVFMPMLPEDASDLEKESRAAFIEAFNARVASAGVWTDEDIQAEVNKNAATWATIGLTATGWHRCELEDFPTEHHDFRDAWTVQDGKIVVDIDKAREVTKNRLRAERAPVLASKDIEVMKALEAGDKNATAVIAAEKQYLRDITTVPELVNATTLDELRAVTVAVPTPENVPLLIPRRVIIDRLETAGLLDKAKAVIDAADLYTQERWNARTDIFANDPTALALLQAIGGDPAVIFAPYP